MTGKIDDLISWYEDEICSQDRQDWESDLYDSLAQRNLRQLQAKKTKLKTELSDVDLVRGSTFPKTKSRHKFIKIVWMSLVSVFLFPLGRGWWIKNTSLFTYTSGCLVYCLMATNMWLYHYKLCSQVRIPQHL